MNKPHILIVEDDLDLSEMISSYFRVQNYDVSTAAWASEALQIADAQALDLIMLDIRLPDIDGFELCRQLRDKRKTAETPIIFLTEKRDRVDKLQGLELGVVDYITKPFDIQELRLRVRNAIQRASQQTAYNPITDLPEHDIVDERLSKLLSDTSNWALLQISIASLDEFRERYGFVAADDVLRAVTLMVRNAVREFGESDDFIGQIGPADFVVVTQPDVVADIIERIERRIKQSREYFYPLRDRERATKALNENHLRLASGSLKRLDAATATDLASLKKALAEKVK